MSFFKKNFKIPKLDNIESYAKKFINTIDEQAKNIVNEIKSEDNKSKKGQSLEERKFNISWNFLNWLKKINIFFSRESFQSIFVFQFLFSFKFHIKYIYSIYSKIIFIVSIIKY